MWYKWVLHLSNIVHVWKWQFRGSFLAGLDVFRVNTLFPFRLRWTVLTVTMFWWRHVFNGHFSHTLWRGNMLWTYLIAITKCAHTYPHMHLELLYTLTCIDTTPWQSYHRPDTGEINYVVEMHYCFVCSATLGGVPLVARIPRKGAAFYPDIEGGSKRTYRGRKTLWPPSVSILLPSEQWEEVTCRSQHLCATWRFRHPQPINQSCLPWSPLLHQPVTRFPFIMVID